MVSPEDEFSPYAWLDKHAGPFDPNFLRRQFGALAVLYEHGVKALVISKLHRAGYTDLVELAADFSRVDSGFHDQCKLTAVPMTVEQAEQLRAALNRWEAGDISDVIVPKLGAAAAEDQRP